MESRSSILCFALFLILLHLQFISAVGVHQPRCQIECHDSGAAPPRAEPEIRLRIPVVGSSFKIALFADLHFGEGAWTDWGPLQDEKSLKAVSPARAHGIPWASVFGNHDDAPFEWPMEWFSAKGIPQLHCPMKNSTYPEEECSFGGTPRLELMKNEIEHNALSCSRNGPRNLWPSISNYVLQVSLGDSQSPVVFMYFLDSGGGSYPEVISSAQANWFERKSQEINPDSRVPEIIFWHIPSKAYEKVAPKFGIRKPCVGSIKKERVAAQEAELGIMKLLAERPSVEAIFVGHNHGLDWCCPYKKLWLCFARHTGYGGYGNWPRGARIIEITQKPFSLKSWIRMEDGLSHSEIVLS